MSASGGGGSSGGFDDKSAPDPNLIIETGTKLGHGTYGTVWETFYKDKLRAVKIMNNGEGGIPCTIELDITSRLQHPNLMTGTVIVGSTCTCMILPRAQRVLERFRCKTREMAEHIAYSLLCALAALHSVNICHNDIHPANIMLTMNGGEFPLVQLIDYSLATPTFFEVHGPKTVICNALFSPYTYFAGTGIEGVKTDVWSVGCVLYQLFSQFLLESSVNAGTGVMFSALKEGASRAQAVVALQEYALRMGIPLHPIENAEINDNDVAFFLANPQSHETLVGIMNEDNIYPIDPLNLLPRMPRYVQEMLAFHHEARPHAADLLRRYFPQKIAVVPPLRICQSPRPYIRSCFTYADIQQFFAASNLSLVETTLAFDLYARCADIAPLATHAQAYRFVALKYCAMERIQEFTWTGRQELFAQERFLMRAVDCIVVGSRFPRAMDLLREINEQCGDVLDAEECDDACFRQQYVLSLSNLYRAVTAM